MSSCPILTLPDFSNPFVVECDGSRGGVGDVLKQGRHPISLERRKLQPRENIKSIYDKEMLSIMHALAKLQPYLVGGKFILKTNHNSIRHFLTQKELNHRHQKWVGKVQSYDFDIEYKRGK